MDNCGICFANDILNFKSMAAGHTLIVNYQLSIINFVQLNKPQLIF